MKHLLILIALCATSAVAQEFRAAADPNVTARCFAGADVGLAHPDCVGEAANICMEQPGGYSTQGMSACMDAETALWDGYLNAEYRARMAQLTTDQKQALRDAQRAWIAFRDADCGLQYQMFIDGTIRSNIYTGCMLEMTAQRALYLRDLGAN